MRRSVTKSCGALLSKSEVFHVCGPRALTIPSEVNEREKKTKVSLHKLSVLIMSQRIHHS